MIDTIYWLWLTMLPGIGPVTAHQLIEKYGSPKCIYENRYDIKAIKDKVDCGAIKRADAVLEECTKKGISIITYDCPCYRGDLRTIIDFPLVLFAKGKTSIAMEHGIGIVGARRCSENGKESAIEIAKFAVAEEKVVISGMAKGIDSYAHTAVAKEGGKTIAILGNGVDICYPSEHQRLYQMISEQGLILSEYPPGTCPRQFNFPRRNRLIAGISDVLYVIDVGNKSGTHSTVLAAEKYGRKVIMVDCNGHREEKNRTS